MDAEALQKIYDREDEWQKRLEEAEAIHDQLNAIESKLDTLLNRPAADAQAIAEATSKLAEHTAALDNAVKSIGGPTP